MRPDALASDTRASNSWRKLSCWPSVLAPRSKARVPMATFQPLPSPPTTRSAPVTASLKNVSLNSTPPLIWTMGRISIPGWSMGTSR